ncbi:hypothetical protein ACJVC5_06725 [Peredibacter sp. HCB2-198]|uniref:hypothetical protein n=1 Tax=Peredibacter sp. HCB2-198 TaxID=3383025 RepID=UPI0038B5146A
MKKLTIVLGLLLAFNVLAQEVVSEPGWKASLRSFVTRIVGEEWGNKLLGEAPKAEAPEVVMPTIPQQVKKATDVESYTKKLKDPTEYDRLPPERKKQYDYKFVEELFQVTRKSEPKDEDLSSWLNILDQGGSREGVYQALVLDEVYNGLESIEEKPTSKLLNFCLMFSQKFLNQTFKTESLNQLNLYSLKRIFTEKGIDLMEYYESRDLDSLYRWYALFSAELAKDYGPFLKTDLRKETSAKYHYEWAKSMPIQHIKSEFIIKLHTVMNGLQLLND